MRSRKIPLFLAISIFIALSDGLFVWLNYYNDEVSQTQALEQRGRRAESTFRLMQDMVATTMQQVATLVGNDPLVQGLALEGKRAVEEEGGGPGGPRAADVRRRLLDHLDPSWQAMKQAYDIRQLHFHLAPGDTSFLRVHKPQKFGDDLSGVRHSIVFTTANRQPSKGFESGRVYSGIRGVIPLFAQEQESRILVGALEAGTSFEVMIQALHKELGMDIGVAMAMEHARETLWPDFLEAFLQDHHHTEHHLVENATSPLIEQILPLWEEDSLLGTSSGMLLVEIENRTYSVQAFDLLDFRAEQEPGRSSVGHVLIWFDAGEELAAIDRALRKNLLFAVVGFVLIEILLVLFWRLGTRRFVSAVEAKTGELQVANDSLEKAQQGAERAQQVSSDFLARMSHEIRNPMNGILGMVRLLSKTPLENDQREMVETMHSSGATLQRILDDILDHSKIQTGRFELEITKFRPRKLVRETVALFRAQAQAKGLTLDCEIDWSENEVYWGDPHRIRQILFNLVGNALKFTEEGSVTIRGKRGEVDGETVWCLLDVRDTGVGISAEAHHEIFVPFVQSDSSVARRYGGTGLGLAICREILKEMKGTISVESQLGVGSVFSIRFPVFQTDKGASDDLGIYVEKLQARRLSPSHLVDMRMLVTEDDEASRRVIVGHLRALGAQPLTAVNGEQALSILEHERFDLIFMDGEMPGLDGIETTCEIRRREEKGEGRTPIVALSAHVLREDRERFREAGMDDYLPKPFTEQQLRDVLWRWLPQRSKDLAKAPEGEFPPDVRESPEKSGPSALSDFLDPKRLRELEKIGEATGTDLIGDLASSLLESVPGIWSELRATLLFDRLEEARPLAHTLKGTLANVGASQLAGQLAELEASMGGRISIEADRLDEVDSAMQDFLDSLRAHLEGGP